MATITFSALPPEIHVHIATYCDTGNLHNLCRTSKLLNERFCHALYRHVDLQLNPDDDDNDKYSRGRDICDRQRQFVRTLLSHPEYGKYVRYLETNDYITTFDAGCFNEKTLQTEFWRTMQLLTHVQSVDLRSHSFRGRVVATQNVPNGLFQSATSVTLAGSLQYGLAKLILNAINPATLKHLCLDLVEEYKTEHRGALQRRLLGTPSGLLTTLTGRCTALRTLILGRIGQYHEFHGNPPTSFRGQVEEAADEDSYLEWAAFIRSVQGTVEEFTFEQVGPGGSGYMRFIWELEFRIMDERFSRLILPMIRSGDWPCLSMMELRGVRVLNGQAGKAALMTQLRAVLGGDAKIVVRESLRTLH